MYLSYYFRRNNPYEDWEGASCQDCKNRKRKHCRKTGLEVPNNWRNFHCFYYN